MTEPRVSFVVIGLDEAPHLPAVFRSIRDQRPGEGASEIIYVDSGSLDGSAEIAREAGVDLLLEIDRSTANAARARNTGLKRARGQFVQFVDGDTEIESGWLAAGLVALEAQPELAGVQGNLREARPDANLYHAVCELDWRSPPGAADFVGGNSLYVRSAILGEGGFDERMGVGEEPELGFRMRVAGHRFAHLDVPMACHDLDLRGIGDYWRRGRASGLACAWVALATGGATRGYWHERLRTTFAHAIWQTVPLLGAIAVAPFQLTAAIGLAVLPGAGLVVLALRKARAKQREMPSLRTGLAVAYGFHSYLFKIPGAVGALVGLGRGPGSLR